MTTQLTADTQVDSDGRVVILRGDLDIATVAAAEAVLADGFDVLDLSQLEFLDSSGVRILLMARQERAIPPVLRGLHGQVLRILQMTGVAEMFVVEEAAGSASVSPSSLN